MKKTLVRIVWTRVHVSKVKGASRRNGLDDKWCSHVHFSDVSAVSSSLCCFLVSCLRISLAKWYAELYDMIHAGLWYTYVCAVYVSECNSIYLKLKYAVNSVRSSHDRYAVLRSQ